MLFRAFPPNERARASSVLAIPVAVAPAIGPILPVVLGSEARALAAAAALRARGLFVPAIRPPTVPPGSSRLRITLSAAHEADDLARLASAVAEVVA